MIKFLTLLLFFTSISAHAQNRLDTLLQQRKGLYVEYSSLKEKKSNFWGTQSKADLRKIIDNLKAIIRKDDEIVREVNRQHDVKHIQIKQESALRQTDHTLKDRNYTDRIYDLNNQVASLSVVNNNLAKENESLSKENESLSKQKEVASNEKFLLENVLLVGFVILLGLIFYIRRLNKKLKQKFKPNPYNSHS